MTLWTNAAETTTLLAEANDVLYRDNGDVLSAATGAKLATLFNTDESFDTVTAKAIVVGDARVAVVTPDRIVDLYGLSGY